MNNSRKGIETNKKPVFKIETISRKEIEELKKLVEQNVKLIESYKREVLVH